MKNIKKRVRQGKVAEIARLDFHDFGGRLLSRTRSKTTEKVQGLQMIGQIMNYYDLSVEDYKDFAEKQLIAEAYEQRGISQESIKIELKIREPIQWTRNERGQIISPFDKK